MVFKTVFAFTVSHISPSGKRADLQQTSGDEHRGAMRSAGADGEWARRAVTKPELTLHPPRRSTSHGTKRKPEEWCQEFLGQIKWELEQRVLLRTLNEEKPPLAFLITQPGLTSSHKTLQPDKNSEELEVSPGEAQMSRSVAPALSLVMTSRHRRSKHKSFRRNGKQLDWACFKITHVLNSCSTLWGMCVHVGFLNIILSCGRRISNHLSIKSIVSPC